MWNRLKTLLAAGLVGVGVPLMAQTRAASPEALVPVEQLVDDLDAPTLQQRVNAMRELFARTEVDLAALEALQRRADLSPEQRLRLEDLAIQRFRTRPRAALGIRFPNSPRGGEIMDVVPGFPAADLGLLRPGDVILLADGVPVQEQAALVIAILSHEPGELIDLVVRRAGLEVEVAVPLGSFRDLRTVPPDPRNIVAAWSLRQLRNGFVADEATTPQVIEGVDARPEIGSLVWEEAYSHADSELVVGGQARGSADLSLRRLAAIDASRMVTLDEDDVIGVGDDLGLQIALVRNRLIAVQDDITRLERRLVGRALDRRSRSQALEQLAIASERLAALEAQRLLLQRVLDEQP